MQRVLAFVTGVMLIGMAVSAEAYGSRWVRKVDVCTDLDRMVHDVPEGRPTFREPDGGFEPGDGFTAFGYVYPYGTLPDGVVDGVFNCAPEAVGAQPLGTFYAKGRFLLQMTAQGFDAAYADWHFAIEGKGTIETQGVVKGGSKFSHAVVGKTGWLRTGRVARVTPLSPDGNRLRIYFAPY